MNQEFRIRQLRDYGEVIVNTDNLNWNYLKPYQRKVLACRELIYGGDLKKFKSELGGENFDRYFYLLFKDRQKSINTLLKLNRIEGISRRLGIEDIPVTLVDAIKSLDIRDPKQRLDEILETIIENRKVFFYSEL